jgi:allophanate hydrolase
MDGWNVLSVAAGIDCEEPYSRAIESLAPLPRKVRIGIPDQRTFCGDEQAEAAFDRALARIRSMPNVTVTPIDFGPLDAVAALLYEGPWVAERRAALGAFFDQQGADMHPTVRDVIGRADHHSAVDAFNAFYKLEAGKRLAEKIFAKIDVLLVPTAPTHYSIGQIEEEPVLRNSYLGIYTNFVNLLNMSALAMPGGFRDDGLPAGITIIGPGGADHRLADFACRLEPALHLRLGTSAEQPPRGHMPLPLPEADASVRVVVVGAHLSGQPLNWQLLERGARLVKRTHTAKQYRLFGLPGTTPPKPGLVRVDNAGSAIEVEIWEMPDRHYGSFVAGIPSPLCIGSLELEDGSSEQGFLCEAWATTEAQDISAFGGWLEYRKQSST